MKLITWNVNSIRARMERLLALLVRHEPDVVCLQETKVRDEVFPAEALAAAGYHATFVGQKTYNGVAILTREPAADVVRGFPGDPIPEQARVLSAEIAGVRIIDAYVVNGKAVGDPKYDTKLAWLDALAAWLRGAHDPGRPLILTGDFNIAPDDRDVHDPALWEGRVLCSAPERAALRALLDFGLRDLHRVVTAEDGIFSWWDYRGGAFQRDHGLRIDLFLGTETVVPRVMDVVVERDERKKGSGEGNPSDHAPVILTLR